MKIQINLASTDYKTIKLVKGILYVIIALSGLMLFMNIFNYTAIRNELKEIESGIDRLKNQEARLDDQLKKDKLIFSNNEMEELNKKTASFNSLLVKRTFFWTLFLSHLEAEVPKNISINSIKPHFADGNIELDGEAFHLKDLTDFIIRLEESQDFKDVFLANQKTEDKEREKVLFSLKVKYQPK